MATLTFTALSAANILTLRRNWIRDEWNAASPMPSGISAYNRANMKNFFTDAQIVGLDAYVLNEYAEELSGLSARKASVLEGDWGNDATAAELYATASVTYARYRLIRAEAFEQMLADPGFTVALKRDDKGALDRMERQIRSDRNFISGRSGLITVPVRRT